jgi:hypothetical protein
MMRLKLSREAAGPRHGRSNIRQLLIGWVAILVFAVALVCFSQQTSRRTGGSQVNARRPACSRWVRTTFSKTMVV